MSAWLPNASNPNCAPAALAGPNNAVMFHVKQAAMSGDPAVWAGRSDPDPGGCQSEGRGW